VDTTLYFTTVFSAIVRSHGVYHITREREGVCVCVCVCWTEINGSVIKKLSPSEKCKAG
jgi:hypothetical protein